MRRLITLLLLLSHISFCSFFFHPQFLSEDEINHVRPERADQLQPCDEDRLMNFLAEIQVINPESILQIATLKDLAPACMKVDQNLKKINEYLGTCSPPHQSDLYHQLIKGVESLYSKLCTDSPFKSKFETVHQCLHELRNDLDDCSGPADWNENSDDFAVCKAYKDVADCYYIKIAKVCGVSAASLSKELVQSIIDSILTINCKNVKETPNVNDAMPDEYIKMSQANINRPSIVLKLIAIITTIII